jgi:Flp pilus assembly pilin Flp
MNKVHSFLRRFARDESGAALAEYAAIFIVLAIAGTTFLVAVGTEIGEAGTAIENWIDQNVTDRLTGDAGAGDGAGDGAL